MSLYATVSSPSAVDDYGISTYSKTILFKMKVLKAGSVCIRAEMIFPECLRNVISRTPHWCLADAI